jgi:hypothetical protein
MCYKLFYNSLLYHFLQRLLLLVFYLLLEFPMDGSIFRVLLSHLLSRMIYYGLWLQLKSIDWICLTRQFQPLPSKNPVSRFFGFSTFAEVGVEGLVETVDEIGFLDL